MGKPRKTKTPAQREAERIAKRAQDLEAVNVHGDAAVLPRQEDIEVTRQGEKRDGRKVDTDQARRLDAFAALKEGMAPGAYDAAKRLERDLHIRYGQHDYGRPERVDCEQSAAGRTDSMIAAGERVDAVLAKLGAQEGKLLTELILPQPQRQTWRQVVQHYTGETNPHAQCAAVRLACVNLRDAYERPVKRRAAA